MNEIKSRREEEYLIISTDRVAFGVRVRPATVLDILDKYSPSSIHPTSELWRDPDHHSSHDCHLFNCRYQSGERVLEGDSLQNNPQGAALS